MTREHKLALIVGFALVLVVGVLLSDHFSKARRVQVVSELNPPTENELGQGVNGLAPVPEPVEPPLAHAPPTITPGAALPEREPARPQPPVDEIVMGGSGARLAVGPDPVDAELLRHFEPTTELARVERMPPDFVFVPERPAPPVRMSVETPASAPPPVEAKPEIPLRRYDVREGDSVYRIAQENYGDGALWTKLREFNKDKISASGAMKHGVTLMLPPREVITGKPATGPAQAPNAPAAKPSEKKKASPADPKPERAIARAGGAYTVYTVKRGDQLSDVARAMLGSSKRWPELAELNKDVLEDPDTLTAGMKLKIPPK